MILTFLITVGLASTVLCQSSVSQCNRAWSNQARCLSSNGGREARNDNDFPVPDPGTQNRIKRDVTNCFKKQRCRSSPIPSNQEINARRDCFKNAKRQLDQELERCVNNKIRGWNSVAEYPRQETEEWEYTVASVNSALRNPRDYNCDDDSRSRQQLQQCIDRDTNYNFNKRPPRNLPRYWCQVDARCWYETGDQCQRQWDDQVQPVVCQCARKLNSDRTLKNAQDDYRQCVDRRARRDGPQTNVQDPAYDSLSDYVKDLCQNKNNHPCKRERRDYDNRRG